MGNEIAIRGTQEVARASDDLTYVQRLGGLLAASGYFADAREMAQAAVKVMAGQELGISPIASMMGINVIKGKVALGGNLIASRIRAHGYDYRHKRFDETGCVLVFFGKPVDGKRETLGESSFTVEDAKAASLLGSDMYKKYPRNMYFNRAISNGAKWYCPEVFAGAPVYTPEELGAKVDENGDMVVEQARPVAVQGPQHVAQQKIAEMEAGKSYAEVSSPDPRVERQQQPVTPMKPWSTFKGMIECFGEMKAKLGDEKYYLVLEKHKVEHSNQFKTGNAATACYTELAAIAAFTPDPADNGITDEDLPQILRDPVLYPEGA